MILTPKNWESFQHYKDRAPAWIKLHRGILDNYEFSRLPVASRALAPMLWLLASEYDGGKIIASLEELAFRFRMLAKEVAEALNPLLEAGFFACDSDVLAPCAQGASLEKKERREEREKKIVGPKRPYSVEFEEKFWKPYPKTPIMSKAEAWTEWQRLTVDEQAKAIAAIPPYVAFLKSKPDHPPVHACRFLKQKRFEGFEVRAEQITVGIPIRPGTDQFKAWMAHFPRKSIQYSLMVRADDTGQPYYAPAEWPPGYFPVAVCA